MSGVSSVEVVNPNATVPSAFPAVSVRPLADISILALVGKGAVGMNSTIRLFDGISWKVPSIGVPSARTCNEARLRLGPEISSSSSKMILALTAISSASFATLVATNIGSRSSISSPVVKDVNLTPDTGLPARSCMVEGPVTQM